MSELESLIEVCKNESLTSDYSMHRRLKLSNEEKLIRRYYVYINKTIRYFMLNKLLQKSRAK